MTRIDIGGTDDEETAAADGLLALVVAVVEILVDALEREAVRRMDDGDLSEEEIERLGTQLASLEEEIDGLKAEMELEEPVDDLRGQLDGLVGDALSRVRADEFAGDTPTTMEDLQNLGRVGPGEASSASTDTPANGSTGSEEAPR